MTAKRPTRLRVGPFTFSVDWTASGWAAQANAFAHLDADMARYYGFTDRASCTIWINPHAIPQFQREALLHEVMHACQIVAGLPNSGQVVPVAPGNGQVTGEDFITRISPVLLDTLDRNPGLRAYLFQ